MMSVPDSPRMPLALLVTSRGLLVLWLIVAAFPLFWMTVMSVRLPVDAFSTNPLQVLLGHQTRSVKGGLSPIGFLIVGACAGLVWYWARARARTGRGYSPSLGRGRPGGLVAIGAGTAVVAIVLQADAFRALESAIAQIPVVGHLARPVLGLTLDHFRVVWIDDAFYRQFANTMLVTVSVVTISVSLGTLAAYGLARSKSQMAFWLLMAALIFRAMPHSVLVAGYLPVFANSREILQPLWDAPLLGTLLGLLSPEPPTLYGKPIAVISILVAINQPFTIWMLRSFFAAIPTELDDAARVDGCSQFGAFWRVILPVMWPGILTTALFSFLLAYNDYLVAALLLDAQSQTMVPTISQYINSENNLTDQLRAIAAAVSVTAPLFLLVMAFQRHIVAGLTLGAVKG